MPLLLNIDTATEFASICISKNGNCIGFEENKDLKNHAAFLQPAIKKLVDELGINLNDLDAISVTNGPGSYTGLRIGLSSAKGLCFTLDKPLIVLNTLEVIAKDLIVKSISPNFLFCPMIDARRMEVFTAIYTNNLHEIIKPCALIIDASTFETELKNNQIIFGGSGYLKLKTILKNANAIFNTTHHSAKNMIELSEKKYNEKNFADLAYSTPNYHKEFYTPIKKIIN